MPRSSCIVLALAACAPTPELGVDAAPVAPDSARPDAGGPPPKGTPAFLELLLTQVEPPRLQRGGIPFEPFGAIQCCMPFQPAGTPINSRWPLASEAWMDHTGAHGANYFHFRMGPFYGDANHEVEWADVGGPYGGSGPEWNAAFWAEVRTLAWYAGTRSANVEVVVVDTWYCKHAQIGWEDQEMPWPVDDVEACGRSASPGQERFIRKVVEELGCLANLTWLTDNEGGNISGTRREWYEWVHAVIRDEEQRTGCGIVHLVGTNHTDFADGPFDYVTTHARAPLTAPFAGKHSANNERNPAFSPVEEHASFCAARAAGLHWWLWRAGMDDADFEETLGRFGGGCN